MNQADNSVDKASFRDSIPDSHQPTFTLLQQLIEELVPDADVSVKWGTIAYDLDGGLFALSANVGVWCSSPVLTTPGNPSSLPRMASPADMPS